MKAPPKPWWPVAAVLALAAALALEIPRKALFPEASRKANAGGTAGMQSLPGASASFVVLAKDAEQTLLANARAAWRLRSGAAWLKTSPDWTEPVYLEDDTPAPLALAPDAYFGRTATTATASATPSAPALPPLAAYRPPSLAGSDDFSRRDEKNDASATSDGRRQATFDRAALLSIDGILPPAIPRPAPLRRPM